MKLYSRFELVILVLLLANVTVSVHSHNSQSLVFQAAVLREKTLKDPLNAICSAPNDRQTKLVTCG